MRVKLPKRCKLARILRLVVVLMVVAAVGAPTVARAAEHRGTIRVFQTLQSDDPNVPDTYSYELRAASPGAPLPAGAQNGVYTWTMTGDDSKTMVITPASQTGGWEYTMRQIPPKAVPEGLTCDDTTYTVRAYPLRTSEPDGSDVIFYTYDSAGEKVTDPGWTVTYQKPAAGESGQESPESGKGGEPAQQPATPGKETPAAEEPGQESPETAGADKPETAGADKPETSTPSATEASSSTPQTGDYSHSEVAVLLACGVAAVLAGAWVCRRARGSE